MAPSPEKSKPRILIIENGAFDKSLRSMAHEEPATAARALASIERFIGSQSISDDNILATTDDGILAKYSSHGFVVTILFSKVRNEIVLLDIAKNNLDNKSILARATSTLLDESKSHEQGGQSGN